MSDVLDQIIQQRKSNALDYEAYLSRIAELAKEFKMEVVFLHQSTPLSCGCFITICTKMKRQLL